MIRTLLLALSVCLMAGCGEEVNPKPDPANQPAAPERPHAPAPAEQAAAAVNATVKVVDLNGNALSNMAPIVTREPNAFDPPVATGSATDADGIGRIRFHATEHLYLRAWDPTLHYFPNNFYEVLPGGNTINDTLQIQMVPAARLEAQLFLPDGTPAANQAVGVMLYHPTRGAWWPAESKTGAEGAVAFPNLPAGEYVLRFKVESGARLEKESTPLPPGSTVNLGILTLQ